MRLRAARSPVARSLLVAVLVTASSGVCSAAASAEASSVAAQSLSLLSSEVSAYAGPLGPYRDGIWHSPNTICWACNQGGPATAAATAYMLTGRVRPELLREAEDTIDTAIATRQRADGAFAGPRGDTQSPDIATMCFGVEEGNTYLTLLPVLDAARRTRWQASLAAAASFLIHNGNVTWYTNGNINLGNVELLYLAWRATGDAAFHTAFERAWSFTLSPPQSRWPGRGLVVVRAPERADGSDGAGYLSETGAGGTGFDPEYTSLQLDVASRLYLLSGDPRVLRLANLLVNMLLPRVDSAWRLDTSGGARHTEPGREVSLITSAFAVLGLHGGRADLIPFVLAQLKAIGAAYSQPWNAYGEVFRRALGNDISVIALASNLARPVGWAADARAWRAASRRGSCPAGARCRGRATPKHHHRHHRGRAKRLRRRRAR